MALTVLITSSSPPVVAGVSETFIASVTNTGAASVTLQSLQISESTESDCQISQPNITATNAPIGIGNPVLLPGQTVNYPFGVVFPSPAFAGPSPNTPGLGPTGMILAEPADPFFTLSAQAQSSDGSVAVFPLVVTVLSTIRPFPVPQGGGSDFSQFNNTNTIAVLA